MLFTSGTFLFLYLPAMVLGFFLIGRWLGAPLAAAWLALGSLFFYGYWRIEHVPLLAGSIAFNYLAGRLLQARVNERSNRSKLLLTIAIASNLLLLAYFKYANFLIGSLGITTGALDIVLPIGISFFTFTQIAYLVDSYAGKVKERSPIHYVLFVVYFPHLIAGPVLHHAEMMPQFARREIYAPQMASILIGLAFLLIGLFKKIIVADSAAPIANDLFDSAAKHAIPAWHAWEGVLAYTIQIYFDFSGYSDMAIGLSCLFGVRLPYNFDSPYKARSIIDFWRRWHMTLSRFLRDYLYVALGGNRKGALRRYVNLALTMLLGGLWHGASWTFVIWGGLHAIFLIVNHGWRYAASTLVSRVAWMGHPVARWCAALGSRAITIFCVAVAWVFFRSSSHTEAVAIINSMLGIGAVKANSMFSGNEPLLFAALAAAMLLPNSQQLIDGRFKRKVVEWSRTGMHFRAGASAGAAAMGIVMLALISASREVSEFIYFNF